MHKAASVVMLGLACGYSYAVGLALGTGCPWMAWMTAPLAIGAAACVVCDIADRM